MKGPPTSVSLLLTNLRLLDFDFDAFPVTDDAFGQSSANKSKTFEHIIYHLYHTFDPEECELKLQNCWPVYEGAQGKELRAVIYTWLEELKKSGRLPGIMLRRSTLDDCSGARYEELMLALSTMVLKHKIESGGYGGVGTIQSYLLATATSPTQECMDPLIYAHEYGLRSIANVRQQSKSQWTSFSALLDAKEAELESAVERAGDEDESEELTTTTAHKPYGYEESIRNKWQNNWIGEPKWLDILLNGDPESTRDRLLELPFDQALKHHDKYTGDFVPRGVPSLKELENKVKVQQERVERMRQLKERIGFSSVPNSASPRKRISPGPVEKRGLKVMFRKHLDLHYGKMQIPRRRSAHQNNEYTELLTSLQDGLALASGARPHGPEGSQSPKYTSARYIHRSSPGPLYGYAGDAMDMDDPEPAAESSIGDETSQLDDSVKEEPQSQVGHSEPKPQAERSEPKPSVSSDASEHDDNEHFDDDIFLSLGISPRISGHRTPASDSERSAVKISQHVGDSSRASYQEYSEEDEVMEEAHPLPPPRSPPIRPLGEKRKNQFDMEDAHPPPPRSPPIRPLGEKRKNQFDDVPYLEPPSTKSKPRMSVKQSMGFMDDEMLAQQIISGITNTAFSPEKPTPAKPKVDQPPYAYNPASRPVHRPSLSPALPQSQPTFTLDDSSFNHNLPQDESSMALPSMLDTTILDGTGDSPNNLSTPRAHPARRVSTTPKEDLLVSEDYSSVFKSRPKVALSPPFSPTTPRGVARVPDYSYVDDDEDDEDMGMIQSPLMRKTRPRVS